MDALIKQAGTIFTPTSSTSLYQRQPLPGTAMMPAAAPGAASGAHAMLDCFLSSISCRHSHIQVGAHATVYSHMLSTGPKNQIFVLFSNGGSPGAAPGRCPSCYLGLFLSSISSRHSHASGGTR